MLRSPSEQTSRREPFGLQTPQPEYATSPSHGVYSALSQKHGSEEVDESYGKRSGREGIDLTEEEEQMWKEEAHKQEQEKLIQAYIKRLDLLNPKELETHLAMCGMSEDIKRKMYEMEFDGATWKQAIIDDNNTQSKKFIFEDLKMDMGTYYKYTGKVSKYYKKPDTAIKDPPIPPSIDKGHTLCTVKAWIQYKAAIKTWLRENDNEMADMGTKIMNEPWAVEDLGEFTERMSKHMTHVDQKWAASLEKSDLMTTIRNASTTTTDYTNSNGASGTQMFKILCIAIAKRSTARLEGVMEMKNKVPKPKKPETLHGHLGNYYPELCEEYKYQTGQDMHDIEKRHILYTMADELQKDTKYASTLTIPLADLKQKENTTSEQVRKLLLTFSQEYGVRFKKEKEKDPVSIEEKPSDTMQFNAVSDEEAMYQSMATSGVFGANPGVPRSKIFLQFRETHQCRNGPNCPYEHKVKGTEKCDNEDFVKYGFCSNWFNCTKLHPYDAIKHGPRETMLVKYREMKRSQAARKYG